MTNFPFLAQTFDLFFTYSNQHLWERTVDLQFLQTRSSLKTFLNMINPYNCISANLEFSEFNYIEKNKTWTNMQVSSMVRNIEQTLVFDQQLRYSPRVCLIWHGMTSEYTMNQQLPKITRWLDTSILIRKPFTMPFIDLFVKLSHVNRLCLSMDNLFI